MTIEDRIRIAVAQDADHGRLPSGFSARVVEALPGRRPVARWRFPLAAASAAAVLVIVAIVAVQVGTNPAPTASPGRTPGATPSSEPTGSPSASPTAVTSVYPDGIPSAIDGQPVFRGKVATAHAAAMSDDTSFLVGGQLGIWVAACIPTIGTPAPPNPLLPWCGGTVVDSVPIVGDEMSMTGGDGARLVVRVHVHDPRAADCDPTTRDACERAIVAEEVVWVGPLALFDHRADAASAKPGRPHSFPQFV